MSVTWPLLPATVPVTIAPVCVMPPVMPLLPAPPNVVVPVAPVVMPAKATDAASRKSTALAVLLVVATVPRSEMAPSVVPSSPSMRMSPELALIVEPASCVMPAPCSDMLPNAVIDLAPTCSDPPSVSSDAPPGFDPSPAETLASRIRPSVESRREKSPSVVMPFKLSTVLPELVARLTELAVLTTSLLAASGPTCVTAPVMSPDTPIVTVPLAPDTVPSWAVLASRIKIADDVVEPDTDFVVPAITMAPALASRTTKPVPASMSEPADWVMPTPVSVVVAVLPAFDVTS